MTPLSLLPPQSALIQKDITSGLRLLLVLFLSLYPSSLLTYSRIFLFSAQDSGI